ncbi:MAG: GPW/gp25 family protein [Helicobacteraceae bacterium]|nr:GPW/gp25 family protein [Helicobacteraceae bacterium]
MAYLISIQKSIARILATPLGSRVCEPDFGSQLYELIDKRIDPSWRLKFIRYCHEAINKSEPRATLKAAKPVINGSQISASIEVKVVETGELMSMETEL